MKPRLLAALSAAAVLAGVFLYGTSAFGSWAGLRQRVSGQLVIVANPSADLGPAPQGQPKDFAFQVRNCSGKPVTLLGLRTSCGCVTSAAFPLTIPAGAWHTIAGQIRPTAAGRQTRALELYSDDPTAGRVSVAVSIVGQETSR